MHRKTIQVKTTLAALGLAAFVTLAAAGTARAIVAGDPNPPKDSHGNFLYPPDDPNNPYNPMTQTGRLDSLGLNSPFSGVGTIAGGTGTLLDATHVLTAAHLFGQSDPHPKGLNFSLDNGHGTTAFQADRVDVCPGFAGVGRDDRFDIAIVTLSAPVPTAYKTYSLDTGPLDAGTVLTLVGYGQTGDGVNGYAGTGTNPKSYPGGRRVGKVSADGFLQPGGTVIAPQYQPGDQTYAFEFYSPAGAPNPAPNYLGGASLGNGVETTLGSGDSGGPAFVDINGRYEIAAINNFRLQFGDTQNPGPADGYFGSGGGGAIVSAYTDFIHSADPTPAPEAGTPTAFGVYGVLLLAATWRRRRG